MSTVYVSAAIAFFSTTLDDFAVLVVFFGRAQSMTNVREAYIQVALGQTIGFTIVVLISLIGLLIGAFIPDKYVALIGFFPLYMGLLHLYEILKEDGCLNRCSAESEADATAAAATSGNATGFARVGQDESDAVFENSNPILYSADTSEHSGLQLTKSDQSDLENGHSGEQPTDLKMEDGEMEEVTIILSGNSEDTRAAKNDSEEKKDEEEGEEEESNALADCVKTHCQYWMHPFILEVTAYALVCSSDNIGIYIALFSAMSPMQVILIIAVFYALLAFNIIVAAALMQCKWVANVFEEYSKYFIPPLLIALGLYILSDSVIWPQWTAGRDGVWAMMQQESEFLAL